MLRAVHGDIYTQAKLLRFNLSNTDRCPRCDGVEDLAHKLLTCPYINKIWNCAIPFIRKLNSQPDIIDPDRVQLIIGATKDSSLASLTLAAEIIQTILSLNPEQNFTLHPKFLVKRALKNLSIKESRAEIKRSFIELINETNSD